MKVLIVCAKLNIGGLQAVAANISKYADEKDIYHYIVFGEDIGEFEQEILDRGNKIFHWHSPSENIVKYYLLLLSIMRKEKYDVVHCHTMYNCGIVMLAAQQARVPCRISHSHNTDDDTDNSLRRKLYRGIMRRCIISCSNEYFACGVGAGNYLYGEKWFAKYGTVITNGLEFDRFAFSEVSRNEVRKELGVEKSFVIGHTGHYERQKNQEFLIRLMPEILKERSDAIMLLFGDGPFHEKFQKLISELNLETKVILMGNYRNIEKILSAMDVFVFPSLFEGTPLSLLEAQANGLPCVISTGVPQDAWVFDDIVHPVSLREKSNIWVNAIVYAERGMQKERIKALSQRYDNVYSSMEKIYKIYKKYAEKK